MMPFYAPSCRLPVIWISGPCRASHIIDSPAQNIFQRAGCTKEKTHDCGNSHGSKKLVSIWFSMLREPESTTGNLQTVLCQKMHRLHANVCLFLVISMYIFCRIEAASHKESHCAGIVRIIGRLGTTSCFF